MKKKEYITPNFTVIVLKAKHRLLDSSLTGLRRQSLKDEDIPLENSGGDLD